MKPEFFMFIDERYEPAIDPKRIVVSSIVIEQDSWRKHLKDAALVGNSRAHRRMQLISELLVRANGHGVIMYADTASSGGRVDSSVDVQRMTRNDNVWSTIVICNIFTVLRRLNDDLSKSAIIDVCHDPKSLTAEHSSAFQNVIQSSLPEMAKDIMRSDFSIRRIDSISKPTSPASANEYQQGVMMAHHLCSNATRLISGENMPNILCKNASNTIQNHLALFSAFSS